jgi:predicted lipoprotein with Yx(FWY)xxD motif
VPTDAATTSAAPTTAAVPATTAAAAAAPAGAASLSLATDPKLGPIVVDSQGFTLYLFTKDTSTASVCTGGCAKAWPPADVTGTPTVGAGLDQSKVGVAAQADGTMQLTYGGHLLYRYAEDDSAGQTNGQAEANVWYVVNAAGAQVGP